MSEEAAGLRIMIRRVKRHTCVLGDILNGGETFAVAAGKATDDRH
jgi:hypothetical protein